MGPLGTMVSVCKTFADRRKGGRKDRQMPYVVRFVDKVTKAKAKKKLFFIAMCFISNGPVSQHFYWLFGGKLKKSLKI